jgi:hypothetical protein
VSLFSELQRKITLFQNDATLKTLHRTTAMLKVAKIRLQKRERFKFY